MVDIELAQTQPGDPYRLQLEVLGTKVEMTQKRQRFAIPADRPPAAVPLDPDTWVLADFSGWRSASDGRSR
jgi:hypothetical protein